MLPEIASVGPFTIHSYGVVIALGVLLSLFLMTKAAKKEGFPPAEKVFDLVFVVVLSGFVGARLFYILQEWPWYREHPWEIVQIWKGGLVYYGGMTASFLGCFIYARLVRLPFLASADFMMPYIALTHALGRVGCFLNGCCYGKVTSLPWGVIFPALSDPVHPTQFYEAIFNLGLFGFLVWLYARRRFTGEIVSVYLIYYSTGRFLIEFWRGDQAFRFLGLTTHQGLSVFFIATGLMVYRICRHGRGRR